MLALRLLHIGSEPLWLPRRVCAPKERQVGQGVGEFLRRDRGVGKHACAGMSFPDCTRALFVSLQMQCLRISQIDRLRTELLNERGSVGCELRPLVLVPIDTMAVVAHPFPVENLFATPGITSRLSALG